VEAYVVVVQGYPAAKAPIISQIPDGRTRDYLPDLLPAGDEPRYAPIAIPWNLATLDVPTILLTLGRRGAFQVG